MVVVGLNTGGLFGGDDVDRIRAFVEQTGATFPVAEDTANSARSYVSGGAISPFPLDVVVGKDGTVAFVTREYSAEEFRAVIERELQR